MKKIKVLFVDFWDDFNQVDNIFISHLSKYFDISIDSKPDYLFYSVFGNKHLEFKNCIKIYFTGENDVPDFNFCDYAIGFHHINFEDRYLRYPLYLLYDGYDKLKDKHIENTLVNRKFCNFVYSNSKYSTPLRENFYRQLSKYKKIDSGGRFLNNIGGAVQNKLDFIKDYKFTIAFENSSQSGYTTEKIMEPMVVNSLPIYWGNPNIQIDFNQSSIVNIQSFSSFDDAIDEIIYLDKDEQAYLNKLSTPWLTAKQLENDWEKSFTQFLYNIFEQPIDKAVRRTLYGYAIIKKYKEAGSFKFDMYSLINKSLSFFK